MGKSGSFSTAVDKIVSERQKRPFEGIDDLVRRVPELQPKRNPMISISYGAYFR